MIIATKPNTTKMTHDLKEMMLEMLEQVPGDNKNQTNCQRIGAIDVAKL